MAVEKGSTINYTNLNALKNGWHSSWTLTGTSRTVCVCGSSFVVRCRAHSAGVIVSSWVDITGYYYNGTDWVQAFAPRNNNKHTVYKTGNGNSDWWFYHNRSAEGTSSEDQHRLHLWKFDISMSKKDGSAVGYFDIWYGGVGMLTESEYNSYVKGYPIKWCQPTLAEIGEGFTSSITQYKDAAAFLAAQRPSVHRGTQISIANGSYLCATNID